MDHKNIAFVGLGNMGLPMALNLAKAGHSVAGFDIASANQEAAEAAGLAIAGSVLEAIDGSDVIITMLPAGAHVLAVYNAIAPFLEPGRLLIDCSTIDVESAREAHALAAVAQCQSLDAPVSGGTNGAAAGTLTFMAGGSMAAFALAKPVFAAMGSRVIHCGDAGTGQAAKICNNMILGISMIAVSEAFVLAGKLGLSNQALFDVASTSSGQCWSLSSYCPVPGPVPASPANNGYKPGFAAALMLKDLTLAADAAEATGVALPMGGRAAELYAEFAETGHGSEDFSAIIRMIRG
jgi:3-hydroxyisobutyrate dehydrogenase